MEYHVTQLPVHIDFYFDNDLHNKQEFLLSWIRQQSIW